MILYMHAKRTGARRTALIGAALVLVLGAWWLSAGTALPEVSSEAAATVPAPAAVAQVHAPAVVARAVESPADAAPIPVPEPVAAASSPIEYVGQWMEGNRRTVLLGYRGSNVLVHVPGRLDDRYEVVAADERQLVLHDLATASTLHVGFGSAARASAVPNMPPVRQGAATPTAEVVPRGPQLPSKRDENEPEG